MKLRISANFVVGPIKRYLEFWNERLGFDFSVEIQPYNQIIQMLLSEEDHFQKPENRSVILLQLERWLSLDRDDVERGQFELFCRALERTVENRPGLICLVSAPASPRVLTHPRLMAAEASLGKLCEKQPKISHLSAATLQQLYAPALYEDWFDSFAEKMADIPYSEICFSAMASALMRQFYHKQVSSRKVIVSDCDNTLWKGVCSEEQVSEIKICSPQEELQKRLIQQAENGRLVCLCSKNNEGDVLRLFTDHPGMLLRREHLCRWQINWGDKAQNIRILSEEIGLSLESFIFIDDDPVECARVSQSHPEILVLNLPADDSKWLGFLNSIWDLDIVSSTIEDKQRTEYYNTSRKRLRSNEGCVSMEDFLRSLNLRIEIALMSAVDIPRAAQLTERTNQFNLNGGRIAIAALTDMCKSEREKAFVVRVTDRFGDYGFVGFFIVETSPERLVVSTFVLSCRAIGKRVEYHMATRIAVDAMERGYDEVHFRFKKTNKNHLIEEFLSTLPVGHRGARNAFDPNCLLESCRRLLLHDVTL